MANGENLAYDWRFNVVDEPTEWAFNWDYSEGGTSQPTPRDHHATMILTMNCPTSTCPLAELHKLFKKLSKRSNRPFKLVSKRGTEEGDYMYKLKVKRKKSELVLLEGAMQKRDHDDGDPNVGNYATFEAKSELGISMAKELLDALQLHGLHALIPHERVEKVLKKGYRVVSVTGLGPDSDDVDNDERGSLATRFTLFHEDEEVARCHMTYTDCSYDPSIGPTVEMITVKQSRRGEGLAKILWYWVNIFIEDNFTIECMNNVVAPGHVMVKATQLTTSEVETREEKKKKKNAGNEDMHISNRMIPVGFKELMYDYCGFSVREQKGVMAAMCGRGRPKDEEAVKYIPLLSREELLSSSRTHEALVKKMPKIGKGYMRAKVGKRICMFCGRIGSDGSQLLRCASCGVAFYCDKKCQKEDWTRHKKWCAKPREDVRKTMLDEGIMTEDGGITIDPRSF